MGIKLNKAILFILMLVLVISLSGCVDKKIEDKSSVKNYYGDIEVDEENRLLGDIILSLFNEKDRTNNIPIVSEKQEDAELVLNLFNFNSDILESYAILTDKTNEKTDTIVIVSPKVGYETNVLIGLEKRIVDFVSLYDSEEEREEQRDFIESIVFEQYRDTRFLILVISESSNIIFDEISKGIAEWDASVVSEVKTLEGKIEK